MRSHTGESNPTRGEDGEFNDYLEKRRPFVEADNLRTSHWFEFDPNMKQIFLSLWTIYGKKTFNSV